MSQSNDILAYLKQRPNRWVPMPVLARISGAYAVHSRASDLRKRGHDVENKTIEQDGTKKSFYRLNIKEGQGSLFGDKKARHAGAYSQ